MISWETTCADVVVYANLVAHVKSWGELMSAPTLTLKTWVALCGPHLLARVWRACPDFWKAHVEAVVCGAYRHGPLSRSAATAVPRGGAGRLRSSQLHAARSSFPATHVGVGLSHRWCWPFVGGVGGRPQRRARLRATHASHGDHVPLAVRNAVVIAFWLLDLLGIESAWSSHVSELCAVA